MKDIKKILSAFPKVRNPLPQSYQDIYVEYYKANRNGETTASSLAQKLETWLHKKVAKDRVAKAESSGIIKTLEIGAGTLNQLKFESDTRHYDVIEPFKELYQSSPFKNKINCFFDSIQQVYESAIFKNTSHNTINTNAASHNVIGGGGQLNRI